MTREENTMSGRRGFTMARLLIIFSTLFYFGASVLYGADLDPAGEEARPAVSTRIVGGERADPDAWPWMAALIFPSTGDDFYDAMCGGSLIRP
ncbi:MAG: trypsin-like serine protease, partial [Desulfobacterales bacterium]|nr:trypsin-like serine protease [Desulfobacterales bacterium]